MNACTHGVNPPSQFPINVVIGTRAALFRTCSITAQLTCKDLENIRTHIYMHTQDARARVYARVLLCSSYYDTRYIVIERVIVPYRTRHYDGVVQKKVLKNKEYEKAGEKRRITYVSTDTPCRTPAIKNIDNVPNRPNSHEDKSEIVKSDKDRRV